MWGFRSCAALLGFQTVGEGDGGSWRPLYESPELDRPVTDSNYDLTFKINAGESFRDVMRNFHYWSLAQRKLLDGKMDALRISDLEASTDYDTFINKCCSFSSRHNDVTRRSLHGGRVAASGGRRRGYPPVLGTCCRSFSCWWPHRGSFSFSSCRFDTT